jgi:hypothetical protein
MTKKFPFVRCTLLSRATVGFVDITNFAAITDALLVAVGDIPFEFVVAFVVEVVMIDVDTTVAILAIVDDVVFVDVGVVGSAVNMNDGTGEVFCTAVVVD